MDGRLTAELNSKSLINIKKGDGTMKKAFGLSPIVLAFVLAGCILDGDNTIILPGTRDGEVPASVIPYAIRDEIEKYMPIYRGIDPPAINGQYLSDNTKLVGSSLSVDSIGNTNWQNRYIAFIADKNGKLAFRSKEDGISHTESRDVTVYVVGTSNEFTAYFVETGVMYGVETTQTSIISGKLTSDGITNYHSAFIMLKKGPDPDTLVVPVNTYRIFWEYDGLAANYNWLTE
jgi:hypothetical protein